MSIQVSLEDVQGETDNEKLCTKAKDVSLGGLAYISSKPIIKGQRVKVFFPLLEQQKGLCGEVGWNLKTGRGYLTGVQFNNPNELYRLRLIEQICHIEHYRGQVKKYEGRDLSGDQAAKEWILKYAADFPMLDP